jgi:peptidoglycan/xylan/chitin deacetylase (PgdA/CDA1 family)
MRTSEVADDKHFDRKDGVYVLCYHGFFNHPDQIIFSLKQLDLHMGTLQKGGFNFISMEDFIAKKYKGLNNVLITSDDGNKSVYKAYYEVFKKYNIKPLIAIYPAITSNRHYALTWEQIAELHKEGCYIAAHGYHHLFLDEKAYRNDPKASVTEVVKSKQVLESKLGFEIDTFVYPYGKRCREVIKIVEETGYKFGFTIEKSINYRNDPNIHQLEMPRYMVMKSNVNEIFELMFKSINKDYEPNPELM